jgi:hypothetical protein
VDSVEGDVVRLLIGQDAARVPAAILPDGVAEGAWIELQVKAIDAPARTESAEATRRKLSSDDDEGPLKL